MGSFSLFRNRPPRHRDRDNGDGRRTPRAEAIFKPGTRGMTFSSASCSVSGDYDYRDLRPSARPQRLAAAAALACVACACAWILGVNLIGAAAIDRADSSTDPVDVAPTRGDRLDVETAA